MQTHICTGRPSAAVPRDACPICADERQDVPPASPSWTALDLLGAG